MRYDNERRASARAGRCRTEQSALPPWRRLGRCWRVSGRVAIGPVDLSQFADFPLFADCRHIISGIIMYRVVFCATGFVRFFFF